MTLNAYFSHGKRKGHRLAKDFAIGAGGILVEPEVAHPLAGPMFVYGHTPYSMKLIAETRDRGDDFYYADNAYYFGRGEYFRVTKNGFMSNGTGSAAPDRWRSFGLEVKPWQKDGGPILVTTQGDIFYEYTLGITRDEWIASVLAELRTYTDREIIVCVKPDKLEIGFPHVTNFAEYLEGAHALVTHSSSTAVGAAIAGVPVFTTAQSMADPIALRCLDMIERPIYPDYREDWLSNLAAAQWTRDEIRAGTAWQALGN